MLRKSLDMQSERQLLISSNVSNMDTPGYKAKDIDFAAQLREAAGANGLSPTVTNGKHIGPSNQAIRDMEPNVFDEPEAARANGNNVNLDKEMGKLAENQIMNSAVVQLMSKRSSTVRAAISESAAG